MTNEVKSDTKKPHPFQEDLDLPRCIIGFFHAADEPCETVFTVGELLDGNLTGEKKFRIWFDCPGSMEKYADHIRDAALEWRRKIDA